MLRGLSAVARDLGRLENIAAVLVRYGFGDLAQRLGLSGALGAVHWTQAAELARLRPPERARRALQDLGPTFVKLGQLLATRIDLFGPEWIAEFEKLQDQAPPSPPDEVRAQLIQDLGAAPEDVFAAFEPAPIAAGSIAQVHRARLADGTEVAVKVRRPGIRAVVEADLRLLSGFAETVQAASPELARFRPREIVRQFAATLRRELNLADECRSAERVARAFRGDPGIVVPSVYWKWTSERVNVQAYVEGVKSGDPAALERAGLDARILAHRGAQAMLAMVLEHGFFHADPHPGNVFYLPGNRVAFIDFGMVGRLSEERRDELVRLLHGLVRRDAEETVEVLLDWAGAAEVDAARLAASIEAFIDEYHGLPLKDIRLGAMLSDMTIILREHRLALPPDLALVLKACATLEATGRALDAEFDMVAQAAPFLRAAVLARRSPGALARRGVRAAGALVDALGELPRDARRLLRAARSGRLQVHVDVTSLERFGRQLDGAASRLTVGVVTAALIIGSSIVMTVEGGPTLLGLPLFGFAGFLGAVAGGAWLLVSILRGGRRR